MTVKELKEELEHQDDDDPVFIEVGGKDKRPLGTVNMCFDGKTSWVLLDDYGTS